MYKISYAAKDATIFEGSPEQNTGIDQVLELKKLLGTVVPMVDDYSATFKEDSVSRILMKFDLTEISQSVASNELSGSIEYFLEMTACESQALNFEYELEAFPLTESWDNGNGNFNDRPIRKNGVSWKYRDNGETATTWDSGSSGFRYTNEVGGGAWNPNYRATQSFEMDSPDLYMNVTDIVNAWLDGNVDNNGLILKYTDFYETGSARLGHLKHFSRETHTIHMPRLIAYGETPTYSGSFNSTDEVDDNLVIRVKGLRNNFKTDEKVKLRLFVRDRYITKTYQDSMGFRTGKRLPSGTKFKIIDTVTNKDIVKFSQGTVVRTDNDGHFIVLDMGNFQPERYYEVIFKIDDGTYQKHYQNNFFFKVKR